MYIKATSPNNKTVKINFMIIFIIVINEIEQQKLNDKLLTIV